MSNCKLRRINDEYHCSTCGKYWDVRDPEPEVCTYDPKATGRKVLADLASMLRTTPGE